MHRTTSPPPRPCPFCDPDGYEKGMDRAQALLDKGCNALDKDRFWAGVALGLAGILRALGTMLCHPTETIEDLCGPDDEREGDDHV